MVDRLRRSIISCAEMHANSAYLRSCAVKLIEEYGTVEDALLSCMMLQVAAEEIA